MWAPGDDSYCIGMQKRSEAVRHSALLSKMYSSVDKLFLPDYFPPAESGFTLLSSVVSFLFGNLGGFFLGVNTDPGLKTEDPPSCQTHCCVCE